MTLGKRAAKPATNEQVVEYLKVLCLQNLRMSCLRDDDVGPPLASAMLEAAAPSAVTASGPGALRGGIRKDQNIEVRAHHALDLLRRIEILESKPLVLEVSIYDKVTKTKKVLWDAIWRGCASEDLQEATVFCLALLSIPWPEYRSDTQENAFKEVAHFHFRHSEEDFAAILAAAPTEGGNRFALDRMLRDRIGKWSSYTELRKRFVPKAP